MLPCAFPVTLAGKRVAKKTPVARADLGTIATGDRYAAESGYALGLWSDRPHADAAIGVAYRDATGAKHDA